MNTLYFILGAEIAVVIILVIATVIMMLKMRKIGNMVQSTESLLNTHIDEVYRVIDQAKSYTDSRFDKAIGIKQ